MYFYNFMTKTNSPTLGGAETNFLYTSPQIKTNAQNYFFFRHTLNIEIYLSFPNFL